MNKHVATYHLLHSVSRFFKNQEIFSALPCSAQSVSLRFTRGFTQCNIHNMSWTVVEFIETNTVEAVPTAWIHNNNECFWPTMARSKIMNEIKNNASPNTCWPLYKVRIFKDGTYEDYMTARKKAKKAEETSDLNSEVEVKRKIIKRKIFNSDSSSEEEVLASSLPKMPKLDFNLPGLNNNEHNADNSQENIMNTFPQSCSQKESVTPRQLPLCSQKESVSPRQLPSCSQKESVTPRQLPSLKSMTKSNEIGQDVDSTKTNCCCKEVIERFDIFSNEITKRMASLKANLFQIREDIQVLSRDRDRVKTEDALNLQSLFSFPFKEDTKLEEFNHYLEDPSNFQQAVIYLKSLGGKDTYEFVKRCLTEVMSNNLAKTFAFEGTKEKKAFKTMKVNLLIESASHQQNGSDKKSYETAVRKWLRRAKERARNNKEN